jgi:hypothetical protein
MLKTGILINFTHFNPEPRKKSEKFSNFFNFFLDVIIRPIIY